MRRSTALLITFATGTITIAAAQAPATISGQTRHLKFSASISSQATVPGQRVALAIDIAPKRGMHVYAPGSKYKPIAVSLQPPASLKTGETVYPRASRYYFKPLNETVDVYDKPFRLTVELASITGANVPETMTLKGTLDYQACDDRVCYLPESIPLQWTLRTQHRP